MGPAAVHARPAGVPGLPLVAGKRAAVTERPARLTFPPYDMGGARIIADGRHEVGRVLAEFTGWRAFLWPEADPKPGQFNPHDVEAVWRLRLGDVRAALRERVAEKGPWWTD